MPNITARTLHNITPTSTPFFIRDTKVKGVAAKVNPTGSIKFIAEVWNEGRSIRKTLGSYPVLSIQSARRSASTFIKQVQTGRYIEQC